MSERAIYKNPPAAIKTAYGTIPSMKSNMKNPKIPPKTAESADTKLIWSAFNLEYPLWSKTAKSPNSWGIS